MEGNSIMDFKQLEAFIKTVELSSFSLAGEALYLSQPSISHHIGNLERELGVRLIMRTTKEVKPTKDGKLFYEYARNIVALKEKAVLSVKKSSRPFTGLVELRSSPVPALYLLPEALAGFARRYPDISFSIATAASESVVSDVLAQRCELGITGALLEEQRCDYRFIMSERLVLIAPPGKSISEANLAQSIYSESLVVREEGSSMRRHALEFLKRLNIVPEKLNIVASLSDTQGIVNAVSKGLGLAVVSEIAAREHARNGLVSVVETPGAPYRRSYYFVARKDAVLSGPARLLMDYVCEHCLAEEYGALDRERAM